MNALIAFVSYHGNSKHVAETLAREVTSRGHQVQIVPVLQDQSRNDDWDVLFVCAPVRGGAVVGPARRFAARVARSGATFALAITHGAPLNHFFSPVRSTRKLRRRLENRGMRALSDSLFFRVTETTGPLEEGFEQKLADLADRLA